MKFPCFLLRFQEVVPRGIPESASVTVTRIKGESRDYVSLSGTETRIKGESRDYVTLSGTETKTVTFVRAETDDNDPTAPILMVIPR